MTTVTPGGQFPEVTQFSTGGGLYVNTDGGATMAVSFGLSWGVYNAGVSIGYVSKNAAIGGILLTAPTTTDYYIAKIEKKN